MIAVRYAKALFELAKEQNILDKVADDMQGIAEVLKGEHNLSKFLENPVVKEQQKKQLFETAFGGRVQPIVSSLLNLLVTKKRENFLFSICLVFHNLYKKEQGYREVVLTTAAPAPEEIKSLLNKKIAEKLQAKVDIKTLVDEDLIGGFKLRVDDMLMDKSIAAQLENMKKELLSK